MSKIIKNTMLNYIPEFLKTEKTVNPARIYEINNSSVKSGNILYLCERELRIKDNHALQFTLEKSKESGLSFRIIHPKICYKNKLKQNFIDKQLEEAQKMFAASNIDFEIVNKTPFDIIKNINPAILIIDFNPILKRKYLKTVNCKTFEIDGHNVIPAKYISDKQEYSAATLRRKIYYNISDFIYSFENSVTEKIEADYILEDFIKNKLPRYSELKNDPDKNITSGLSKYLNLGFISSLRVALEILKSNVDNVNKEAFLEELIVRRELAENFCFYSKSFKDFSGIADWAKRSLDTHKYDIRPYIYDIEELECAKTHDKLWNATQNQLKKEGVIHGYLRMYWAKKILEWTSSPDEALKIAIYLNDYYAYDAPSANGYASILWAIGGLHDRAFADYPITGKIRRMTYDSIKRKYNLKEYIEKYLT